MDMLIIQIGLGIAITLVGFLLKRAIQSLDITLQEIVATIHGTSQGDNGLKGRVMVLEEKANETEQQIQKFYETLDRIRVQIQKEAVKNAESFGEVKTDMREVLSTVREIRNRRDT